MQQISKQDEFQQKNMLKYNQINQQEKQIKFIKKKYLNQMNDQGLNSESQESRKDQTTVITENIDGGDRANIFSY